jgi:hypothetical protein
MLIVALFCLSFSLNMTLPGLRRLRDGAPEGCREVAEYWLDM